MVKHKMSEWRDAYAGSPSGARSARPAAVLGGGPSLAGDLLNLPPDCVLIAVNYHAFHLTRADFVVYNDHPESDPLLEEMVKSTRAVKVSAHPSSDIVFDVPVWTGSYSSNTATWFALWMGCDPVILCGMDCYQGPVVYCHPSDRDVPVFHYPLDDHLRPWQEDGKNLLPHVERVRVMSGPLMRIYPAYVPPPAPSQDGRGRKRIEVKRPSPALPLREGCGEEASSTALPYPRQGAEAAAERGGRVINPPLQSGEGGPV